MTLGRKCRRGAGVGSLNLHSTHHFPPNPHPYLRLAFPPLRRVEVRDLSGEIHSVLFYPEAGTSRFSFRDLRAGCTLCIRYAQRCFFSDLATEAIKV